MVKPHAAPALLSDADVAHVAALAKLRLRSDEISKMAAELSAIVQYVQKLSELDTADVPPTAQVVGQLPLRPDESSQSLNHDQALAEAPRPAHDGFAVPGFIEE